MNPDWPIPCNGEGDAEHCDACWRAGRGDAVPYCAGFEYKIKRAPHVIVQGREWLSWCGEWRLGPFPPDYQDRLKRDSEIWNKRCYGSDA